MSQPTSRRDAQGSTPSIFAARDLCTGEPPTAGGVPCSVAAPSLLHLDLVEPVDTSLLMGVVACAEGANAPAAALSPAG